MQLKPITAIAVLLLVAASLLVSGCTTNTTNQTPSASNTPSTATHDALLEKLLAEYKNRSYADSGHHVRAYETEWINSTSAHEQRTYQNTSTKAIWSYDDTYIIFPTTQDATSYLNAMNKTAYSLTTTEIPKLETYQDVTGHAPRIYKQYEWTEGSPHNVSAGWTGHVITQTDNIIAIYKGKWLS